MSCLFSTIPIHGVVLIVSILAFLFMRRKLKGKRPISELQGEEVGKKSIFRRFELNGSRPPVSELEGRGAHGAHDMQRNELPGSLVGSNEREPRDAIDSLSRS